MPGEEGYYREPENIHINIPAANITVRINVAENDTETATQKYLNKGSLGSGFDIRPSASIELLQLGGKVFRDPIPISTEGLSWAKNIKDFNIIVLRSTAAVQIKLLVT